MSRARSVADLGNQNVLDLNAIDGTLKVGAGVTIENSGEVQFAGIVTAATVQIGAATTLHSTGLDLGAGTLTCHDINTTGTLTYEDVTSVDSVGIITARSGLRVGTGDLRGSFHVGADLASDGTDAAAINLKQSGTTAATGIYLERSGERKGYAIYLGGDLDALNFQRNNSGTKLDVMSMTRDGRVGIGTSVPDELLEVGNGTVSGALKVSGQSSSVTSDGLTVDWESSTNSTRIFSEPSSGGSSVIRLFTTNSGTRAEALRITSAGNVGIRTDNPIYDLSIYGTGAVRNEITCTNNNGAGAGVYMRTLQSGAMVSNATVRTDNAGNFSIFTGTTSDSEQLSISSTGEVNIKTGNLKLGSVSGTDSIIHTANAAGIIYRSDENGHKFQTWHGSSWQDSLNIHDTGDTELKIGTGVHGGALFVGENGNPAGDLPILRDTHQRPIVYVGGSYPEVCLSNQEISNTRHGPILRFTNYAQSSSTAAGNQYIMGTNGTGTFFEISSHTAGTSQNAHHGFDGYPGAGGLTYTAMRIHNDGTIIKPRNCSFRAGRTGAHTPGANGTIIFNTTGNTKGHNVGNHYNTANGIFTAPQPGIYLFTVQVIWESLTSGQAMDDAFHMMVNTTLAGYSGRRAEFIEGTTGNSAYFADHMVFQFQLAANDTVYVRNNRALTVHGNQNYTTFSGYLLG